MFSIEIRQVFTLALPHTGVYYYSYQQQPQGGAATGHFLSTCSRFDLRVVFVVTVQKSVLR